MVVYYDLLRFNTRLEGYVIYVVCKVIDICNSNVINRYCSRFPLMFSELISCVDSFHAIVIIIVLTGNLIVIKYFIYSLWLMK